MLCISAAYAVMRCLSVCLSRSCVVSKRIKIPSKFFHHRVARSSLSVPNGVRYSDANPPNGGVECRWGRQKRDSGRISGFAAYRSTVWSTVRVAHCEKQSRDGGFVFHRRRRASSTPRRPLFAQDDDEVFVTGST